MPEFEVTENFSNKGTRNEVRMRVVNKLSQEIGGKGNENLASRYTYYVEKLADGSRIYLRRPANLHWGFDFVVCVEGKNFNKSGRTRNYPKHDDIATDLKAKKKENPNTYKELFKQMENVFACKEVDLKECSKISFKSGFACDLIVGILKWLFIEQDIRYWNYSGREMFWEGLKNI